MREREKMVESEGDKVGEKREGGEGGRVGEGG